MKNIGTGILEGISTRADGSLVFKIATQEIGSTEAARLFELRNKFLKYLLTDENISPLDEKLIEELKLKDGKKVKTRSQVLRSVLFRLWEISDAGVDFDTWYENEMTRIIDHYKTKLD